jgi:hypothetical protein
MKLTPATRTILAVTVAALGAGATFGLTHRDERPAPVAAVSVQDAARVSFPGLAAATGEPELAGLATAATVPGKVTHLVGPFDDRLDLQNLTFDRTAVSGSVHVTSDVSDLLELQVLAGFYDRRGDLLGTARFVHHTGTEAHAHTGPPKETEDFTIAVPDDLPGEAVAAAVGVPVLVNE